MSEVGVEIASCVDPCGFFFFFAVTSSFQPFTEYLFTFAGQWHVMPSFCAPWAQNELFLFAFSLFLCGLSRCSSKQARRCVALGYTSVLITVWGEDPAHWPWHPGCGESYQFPADPVPPPPQPPFTATPLYNWLGCHPRGQQNTVECVLAIWLIFTAPFHRKRLPQWPFVCSGKQSSMSVCDIFFFSGRLKPIELLEWKVRSKQETVTVWHRQSPLPELSFRLNWLKGLHRGKSFVFSPSLGLFLRLSFELHPRLCRVWLMAAIH